MSWSALRSVFAAWRMSALSSWMRYVQWTELMMYVIKGDEYLRMVDVVTAFLAITSSK
jgi:hypothetical protein